MGYIVQNGYFCTIWDTLVSEMPDLSYFGRIFAHIWQYFACLLYKKGVFVNHTIYHFPLVQPFGLLIDLLCRFFLLMSRHFCLIGAPAVPLFGIYVLMSRHHVEIPYQTLLCSCLSLLVFCVGFYLNLPPALGKA